MRHQINEGINMTAVKIREMMATARQQEQAGQPDKAGDLYRQVVEADPLNQAAIRRLLAVYRRMKAYRKELGLIETAMGAITRRDQQAQDQWLAAHPEAARLGRAMLKSIGNVEGRAFGANAFLQQLFKRKVGVESKISGKKNKKKQAAVRGGEDVPGKKRDAGLRRQALDRKRRDAETRKAKRQAAIGRERTAKEERKASEVRTAKEKLKAREELKAKEQLKAREARKAIREAAVEQKKKEAEAKKAEKNNAKPSLFVISLRYLVPLEQIDSAMQRHVVFLDKFFKSGDFLVSGRQAPRTGGIILARGKDRSTVERMMRQDPFVREKLASMEIVEFKASKIGKALAGIRN